MKQRREHVAVNLVVRIFKHLKDIRKKKIDEDFQELTNQ